MFSSMICQFFKIVKLVFIISAFCANFFSLFAQEKFSYLTEISLDGYDKYQRFSVIPRISYEKFSFALDVELFFDLEKNNIAFERTFNNSTARTLVDSLLNKIYYFGFSNKEDVVNGKENFYIGVGELKGTTFGTGILVDDFKNTYFFPNVKNVGVSFAFNSQNLFRPKLEVEFFVYDIKDLISRSGGLLTGSRVSVNPIDILQVGISGVLDSNQLSGLNDKDDDGYPDGVDYFPEDKNKYSEQHRADDLKKNGLKDVGEVTQKKPFKLDNSQKDSIFLLALDTTVNLNKTVDVDIPVSLYTHAGILIDDDDKEIRSGNEKAQGFGVGIGLNYTLDNNLKFSIEYRHSQDSFRFGWFDDTYEINRVQLQSSSVITRDNLMVADNYNGFYAEIDYILLNIGSLELAYEFLLGNNNTTQNFSSSLKIDAIFKDIPIITYLQGFFHNALITGSNNFLKENTFLYYGYNIGLDLGNILMEYLHRVNWQRKNDGLAENFYIKISVGKTI